MTPLPIDPHLPELCARLLREGVLLLEAEPGAGKTTRLPGALLGALPGKVLVLEPRRLAARMAARRVAQERGGALGDEVGYQVRFENETSARTRLIYLTEGVLTRRLAAGDRLEGVSAVVLDEFHERHLETDLALVLLDRLRRGGRPDLRLVVMSATLEAAPLAAWLGCAPAAVAGRLYPVAIEHERVRDARPLPDKVRAAVARLLEDGLEGHVLVFLPGASEIRACERALEGPARAADLALRPLHGRLEPARIEEALGPSRRRKLILATNVAESSLTIEGVSAVIDAGLQRVAGISARTGLPYLRLEPTSRASATQRANRAGRLGPGRCLRLYTELEQQQRPAAATPELLRDDLAGALLVVHGAGAADPRALRWLDAPPEAALARAEELLARLGALEPEGELSEVGRALRELPLPPRLGRTLLAAAELGIPALGADAAALLGERPLRPAQARDEPASTSGPCDVLAALDLLREARRRRFQGLGALGVDAGAARAVDRAARALLRSVERRRPGRGGSAHGEAARGEAARGEAAHGEAARGEAARGEAARGEAARGEAARGEAARGEAARGEAARGEAALEPELALRQALLAGHPDRVGRRGEGGQVALAGGGGGRLAASSVVRAADWLLALDAVDPRGKGRTPEITVASAIEPEWLLERFPEALSETEELRFDPQRERVEAVWELRYGGLVLESGPGRGEPAQVTACLREAARAAGLDALTAAPEREALLKRLAFLAERRPELPALDEAALADVLAELCEGRRSFAELRAAEPLRWLAARLGPDGERLLAQAAPEHVTLPGGRRCEVHYERRQPPWIQSRLQDFFGMRQGPEVAGVPLVLHLLAPNKVAVSVTSDLQSFWQSAYVRERKALQRRYPKHAWPEDPASASPPRPGKVR